MEGKSLCRGNGGGEEGGFEEMDGRQGVTGGLGWCDEGEGCGREGIRIENEGLEGFDGGEFRADD